ncbi:GNAT family N-acetyltransferase [Sphingomonas sp. 1P06PA]|uniref:GNAT family N-acetyltransferase n=1 Tax=Sphingomonas sp. 1P06PA TaxID=554121 RepID=UPI0039A677FA
MFARTERLMLRPGWMEDAPALAAAIGDEAVASTLARVPYPYTLRDAEAFLGEPAGPLPRLLAFARTDGAPRLVGGVGLHPDAEGEVELGYWIARAHWGRGYATEAARAVVGMARAIGLLRLSSCHMVDNEASGRVLRKLGFRPTGRIAARHALARGRLMPMKLFALDLEEDAARPMAA